MNRILRILLILSVVGSLLTILVYAFSLWSKRLPACWLRMITMFALLSFVIPVWLVVPAFPCAMPDMPKNAALQKKYSVVWEERDDTALQERETRIHFSSLTVPVLVVWGIGTILSMARILLPYLHFRRRLAQNKESDASNELLETCRVQIGVKQQVKIIRAEQNRSPSLIGLLRPAILLPLTTTTISRDQLYVIFLHELTHLKNHDLIWKWLAAFVQCIHWWNPFAYLAARLLERHCETACDVAVAARFDDNGRIAYMRTILFFAASNARTTTLTASLSARGREIERRLYMIQNHKPVRRLTETLCFLLSAFLLTAGLSTGAFATEYLPEEKEKEPEPVESSEENLSFVWPVPGYTENSSAYGWRVFPILNTKRFHPGEDIPAPDGTPVQAAQFGKVTFAGWTEEYGNYIVISHGNGLSTAYGCLSNLQATVGQTVAAGQQIGSVGKTGKATGPHLHFEVYRHAETQDPMEFFE